MARTFTLGLVGLIALSSALSMVHAHKEQKPFNADNDKLATDDATFQLAEFKATSIKAPFLEQFATNWSDRWTASEATKESNAEGEVFSYVGQWSVEEPSVYPGLKNDLGLVAKSAATHHAISASLPEVIDNKDKTLVVQYEVKAQEGLECGGAYMKLLTESPQGIKFKEFSNETPYTIMFGPDRCGATDKVHFIFRHKNPITGVHEEKHLQSAPLSKLSKRTTLYTLIVNPDQTFEIKINGESAASGSLLEDFQPPVNPIKEIDDASDSKPANWVEEARIPDAKATKPEDWDEDAPATILDEKATKPTDWLEDEAAEIPDPEAVKPEDWDDEEDGDWVPVSVPNPKCVSNGCGPWVRPRISNPAYKGKWSAPLIDNPDYKGVWAPRKIPNPDFFEDLSPANFEKIGAVGFEIWTMQKDILFDNIYIGHSIADAESLAAESWEIKYKAEKEQEELDNPTPKSEEDASKADESLVQFMMRQAREFIDVAREDPMQAMTAYPLIVSCLAGVVGISFGLMLIIMGLMHGDPEAQQARAAAAKAKKTDAVTAGDNAEDASKVDADEEGEEEFREEPVVRKRATAAASSSDK
ncbi:Calreticulin-domain-containing protein [Linnemannia elongata AG-77]|uniref:Calreticulin-domain-containing protein n=1 Tax=Linnemannia elongata AG-77 TaxID=1314771 RepID=A0A197KDU2_9FUNG|nr:Calreticulin-domain-containing protein [Linnemannia elongata AG-77]